jgi:hypothetical protein
MILLEHCLTYIVLIAKLEYILIKVIVDSGVNRSYIGTILASKLKD